MASSTQQPLDSDAVAAGIWKFLRQLAGLALRLVLLGLAGYAAFMGLLFLYATGNLVVLIPIFGGMLFVGLSQCLTDALNERRARRDLQIAREFVYDVPRINAHGVRCPSGPLSAGRDIRHVAERALQGAESEGEAAKIKRICVDTLRYPSADAMRIALRKFLQRESVAAFDAAQEQKRKATDAAAAQRRGEFAEAGGEPVDLTTAQEHLNLAADMLQAARGTEAEDACQRNHAEKLAALLAAKSHQASMR